MTRERQIEILVRALEGGAAFDGPWVVGDEAHERGALRAVERFLGERVKCEVLTDALCEHGMGREDVYAVVGRLALDCARAAHDARRDDELTRRARIRAARRRRFLCVVDGLPPAWCEVLVDGAIAVGHRVEVRSVDGSTDRPLARWTLCRVERFRAGVVRLVRA